MTSFTLFVGRDVSNPSRHDVGSTLCLSMLDRMTDISVAVELANDIPPRERPYWLRGTPTLIDNENGERSTGFSAYNILTNMAFEASQKKRDSGNALSLKKRERDTQRQSNEPPPKESDMNDIFSSDLQDLNVEARNERKITPDDLAADIRSREAKPSNVKSSNVNEASPIEFLKD